MGTYKPLTESFKELNNILINKRQWDAQQKQAEAAWQLKEAQVQQDMQDRQQMQKIRALEVAKAQDQMQETPVNVQQMAQYGNSTDYFSKPDSTGYHVMDGAAAGIAGEGAYWDDKDYNLHRADGSVFTVPKFQQKEVQNKLWNHFVGNLDPIKHAKSEVDQYNNDIEMLNWGIKNAQSEVNGLQPSDVEQLKAAEKGGKFVDAELLRRKAEMGADKARLTQERNALESKISTKGGKLKMMKEHRDTLLNMIAGGAGADDPALQQRLKYQIGRLDAKINKAEDGNMLHVWDNKDKVMKKTFSEDVDTMMKEEPGRYEIQDPTVKSIPYQDAEGNAVSIPNNPLAIREAEKQGLQRVKDPKNQQTLDEQLVQQYQREFIIQNNRMPTAEEIQSFRKSQAARDITPNVLADYAAGVMDQIPDETYDLMQDPEKNGTGRILGDADIAEATAIIAEMNGVSKERAFFYVSRRLRNGDLSVITKADQQRMGKKDKGIAARDAKAANAKRSAAGVQPDMNGQYTDDQVASMLQEAGVPPTPKNIEIARQKLAGQQQKAAPVAPRKLTDAERLQQVRNRH